MALTLSQDFTQATLAAAPDVGPTLTYGANATDRRYWNSAGQLVQAAENQPRLGAHVYDPVTATWVPRGMLLNASPTTNLCLKSNEINGATAQWQNGGAVSAQNETGPDGVSNSAWTISDNSSGGASWVGQSVTIPVGTESYIWSTFLKKTTVATVWPVFHFDITGGSTVFSRWSVNTNDGTVYEQAALEPDDSGVEDCGNFWRIWVKSTNNGTGGNTTLTIRIYPYGDADSDGGSTLDVAEVGSNVFFGAQIEESDFPTAYVESDTVAGVRSADVLTTTDMTWLDAPGTALGTFVLKGMFKHLTGDAVPLFQLDDNVDTADRIWVEKSATHTIDAHVENASTPVDADGINAVTALSEFQAGLSYANGSLKSSVDGSQIVEGAAVLPMATNPLALRIGSDLTNGGEFFLRELRYWNEVRRDARLVSPERYNDVPTSSRPSIIPFGDSHTALMWRQISAAAATNITTTDGVTTIQTAAAHNAPIGTRFRLGLATTTALNGLHTVIATPTSTSVSFAAPPGAPVSELVNQEVMYFENDQAFTQCWVYWLQAFSQGRFTTGKHGALGGDDAGEALARVSDSTSQGANRAIVMIGTNDALNAVSTVATTEIAEIQSIVDAFIAAGTAVDLCTVPPFGSAYVDIANTTKRDFKINLNNGIRAIAANTAGVNLLDVDIWLTDQANVNKQAIAGAIGSDGIHFEKTTYTSADRIVGEYMAAFYDSWFNTFTPDLPETVNDCITGNPASRNKFPNCVFSIGSGSPPTGTSYTPFINGTGNSQVNTLEARTLVDDGDTFGKNYKSVLTINNFGTHLVFPSTDPPAAGDVTVGKTYAARAAVTLNPGANTAALASQISIAFTVDSITRIVRSGLGIVLEPGHFVFETAPFTWPEGAAAFPQFYLRSTVDDNGSTATMDIEWGRLELLELGGATDSGGFLVSVGQLMN